MAKIWPKGSDITAIWSQKSWNMDDILAPRAGRRGDANLWFTEAVPKGGVNGTVAYAQPFDDLAKGVFVRWFAKNQSVHWGSCHALSTAIRALYRQLQPNQKDIAALSLDHFVRAEDEIIARWELPEEHPDAIAHATARSLGERLQTLCTLLDGWQLVSPTIAFRTRIPLQRGEIVDRHTTPFEERRARLFPDAEVFQFLADLSNRKDVPILWRLRLRAIELQVALGRRISEILLLPKDCLVPGAAGALGVRYFPRKNADPFIAWVPSDEHFNAACAIVKRAVEDILEMTDGPRKMAKWFESLSSWSQLDLPTHEKACWRPNRRLEGLSSSDMENWVTGRELASMLGGDLRYGTYHFAALKIPYRRFRTIPDFSRLGPRTKRLSISFSDYRNVHRPRVLKLLKAWKGGRYGSRLPWGDLEWQTGINWKFMAEDDTTAEAVESVRTHLRERWPGPELPPSVCAAARLPDVKKGLYAASREFLNVPVYHDAPKVPLSELLFVCWKEGFSEVRATSKVLVEPLHIHQMQHFLRGSPTSRSVFEEFGRPELEALSHGFRRWVTTEGRRAGVNNTVLARWMGRSAVQNDVYDYNGPEEFTSKKIGIPTDLSKVMGSVRDLAADMVQRGVPLVERDKFLAAEFKGIIITHKGGCTHEWAVTPCKKGKACYNGCDEFYVVKGRRDHYQRALQERKLIERALMLSEQQVGTAYYANGYVAMYKRQLQTVNRIIKISGDPSIPDGTLVQVNLKNENDDAGS